LTGADAKEESSLCSLFRLVVDGGAEGKAAINSCFCLFKVSSDMTPSKGGKPIQNATMGFVEDHCLDALSHAMLVTTFAHGLLQAMVE
jgi:hypothetical protein